MRKFKTRFKLVKNWGFFNLFVPDRGRRRDQRIVRLRAEVPLVSHREERARNLCLAGYLDSGGDGFWLRSQKPKPGSQYTAVIKDKVCKRHWRTNIELCKAGIDGA